jgi:ABC-type phosphate transport system substrate-binding protein
MSRPPRLLGLMIPALLAALVAGACSRSKSSSSSATTAAPGGSTAAPGGSTAAPAKVSGTLNGSGSTFQAAYNQAAIQAFQ